MCGVMRNRHARWRPIRWLRRWIYKLVCEEAMICGQAALWMPSQMCWCCRASIQSDSRYCSRCGVAQAGYHAEQMTPIPIEEEQEEETPESITDRMQALRKPGER